MIHPVLALAAIVGILAGFLAAANLLYFLVVFTDDILTHIRK